MRYVVKIELYTILAPVQPGQVHGKLWEHLSEEQLGLQTSVMLARNGVRVGVAAVRQWLQIAELLKADRSITVQHGTMVLPAPSGEVSMQLRRNEQQRVVFYYRKDGTLVGRRVEAGGASLFDVGVGLDRRAVTTVWLRFTPEISRYRPGHTTTRTLAGLVLSPRKEGVRFEDLSFELPVAKGQFLMIGPSPRAEHELMLGRYFLRRIVNNRPHDLYLVMVPTVIGSK